MTKVKYSLATWLKCKFVIALVQRRSPLKKIALLYVCTQPHSVLKHLTVAMDKLLGSHYRQLTTSSIFPLMHIKFEANPYPTHPPLQFNSSA